MVTHEKIAVLDKGYIQLIEHWGSDERIIEAARMSTQKGFLGWGPIATQVPSHLPSGGMTVEQRPGDEKLLKTLWDKQHSTPFEMAGFIVEVKAPIMAFREWQRHRTQGYNEMSARYVPLPDENYLPSLERLLFGGQSKTNKQGSGEPLAEVDCLSWLSDLADVYEHAERVYQRGLSLGIARELARLPVPVGRYSTMRATANLRNWLGFAKLRCDPSAQWEIRQYADVIAKIFVRQLFPRTFEVARDSIGIGGAP